MAAEECGVIVDEASPQTILDVIRARNIWS